MDNATFIVAGELTWPQAKDPHQKLVGSLRVGVVAVKGQDIYAFSAPLVCEAVGRILEGGARNSGAQVPGAIFDARDFLDTLAQEHAITEVAAD